MTSPRFLPPRFAAALLTLIGTAFLAGFGMPAKADPVFPQGSRIGLEVPSTLTPTPGAPRFVDEQRKVVLFLLDLPAQAFPEFQTKMFESQNEPGVTVEKREPFAVAAGLGYLMTLKINQNGEKIRKWVFLASANMVVSNVTALVSMDVPESAASVYTEQKVRDMFATITFRNVPIEEQLSLLPYRLADQAGFRVVQTLPPAGVVLTDGPDDRTFAQPGIIISLFPQQPPPAQDRANFATDLLRNFGLPELRVTNSETLRLKGQPVYESRAEAKDPDGGAPLTVVQWVRFGESGFTRIVGVSPANSWAENYSRFRAVRDGMTIKSPSDN